MLGYDAEPGEVERIVADLHGACSDPLGCDPALIPGGAPASRPCTRTSRLSPGPSTTRPIRTPSCCAARRST